MLVSRALVIALVATSACTTPSRHLSAVRTLGTSGETFPSRRARTEAFLRPFVDEGWMPGAMVAFVDDAGVEYVSIGSTTVGGEQRPDEDTLYEIGSITKTFTALVLAQMIDEGKVALDQPVQSLLPDDVALSASARSITLGELATHVSGLPRDAAIPAREVDEPQLYALLRDVALEHPPGARYAYSNVGAGLLGHVLARRDGRTYDEMIRGRIVEPLGLRDTVITPSVAQLARLAPPYDADLRPSSANELHALAGCGAIRSTARDLARYLQAQLGLVETPLTAAMQRQHRALHERGHGGGIGLAWMTEPGGVVGHDGHTRGYHSEAWFDVDERIGVVLLTNASLGRTQIAVGSALLAIAQGKTVSAMPRARGPVLAGEVLEPYVGRYQVAPELVATITREGARLFLQLTGQPRVELHAESDREFFARLGATVRFERDDTGRVTRFRLFQDGEHEAPRIE